MKYIITIAFILFMFSCSGDEKDTPEEPIEQKSEKLEDNNSKSESENKDQTENINESIDESETEELADNQSSKEEFEGSIEFEIIIQGKSDNFNAENSYKYFGKEMTVFYKDGYYLMDYEGGNLDKIMYDKTKNKQYTMFKGFDSLFVLNCQYEASTVYSKISKPSDYDILNKKVNYVGIFTNNVKLHYYYDPEFYINPERMEDHKYGHMDLYYKLAESPFIYSEQEFREFKVIFRPKEIRIKELEMSLFDVPDMPLKESNMNQQSY